MIRRPPTNVEIAARKRGARRLAAANREKALEVRYGMREYYPGWLTKKSKVRYADPR